MTTIAWDGKSVAADSMKTASGGYLRRPGSFNKVVRRADVVFAIAGAAALFEPMIAWYLAGAIPGDCPKDKEGGSTGICVFTAGRCFQYTLETPYPEEMFAPDAIGVGSEFAIGAMRAGADARRAVEIASECNPQTGGPVNVIDLSFQTQPKLVAAE